MTKKDFSNDETFNAWAVKFTSSVDKKFCAQGIKAYLLHNRTASSALSIVDKLRKIPLEAIRFHFRVYRNGEENFPELITIYKENLVRAKKYPENFAKDLFSFYRSTAQSIKENDEIGLFFGLVAFVEAHVFEDHKGDDFAVYTALMDLLLEQFEFLRENPLDYTKLVAGVETDGESIIEVLDPYPAIDYPIDRYTQRTLQGEKIPISSYFEKEYGKLGYEDIHSFEDYLIINARSRMYEANVVTMSAFINEYTSDLLPIKPLQVGQTDLNVPIVKDPQY